MDMLTKLVSLLDRFVVATERSAIAMERSAVAMEAMANGDDLGDWNAETAPLQRRYTPAQRQSIVDALGERGIKFAASAGARPLHALLLDSVTPASAEQKEAAAQAGDAVNTDALAEKPRRGRKPKADTEVQQPVPAPAPVPETPAQQPEPTQAPAPETPAQQPEPTPVAEVANADDPFGDAPAPAPEVPAAPVPRTMAEMRVLADEARAAGIKNEELRSLGASLTNKPRVTDCTEAELGVIYAELQKRVALLKSGAVVQ